MWYGYRVVAEDNGGSVAQWGSVRYGAVGREGVIERGTDGQRSGAYVGSRGK